MLKPRPNCPGSASSQWLSLLVLLVYLTGYFFFWPRHWGVEAQVWLGFAVIFIPLAVGDFLIHRVHRRTTSGLVWGAGQGFALERALTKWLGFCLVLALFAGFYWFVPEYREPFYKPYFRALIIGLPLIVFGSAVYFPLIDRLMKEPEDGYWELGCLLRGRLAGRDWGMIRQLLLGWAVKAFFLPLMYGYCIGNLGDVNAYFNLDQPRFLDAVMMLLPLSYLVDVMFTTLGYLYTLRVGDTHIRSTEPTLLGWLAALVCYQPIWSFFNSHYVKYADGYEWQRWLGDAFWLSAAWGGAIVLFSGIYAWATVCFGLRFSNLTYRGLISTGPYRWTRHPAYLFKNMSWWLIYIPFIPGRAGDDVWRDCLALGLVNLIYFVRAKTEERHLFSYPEYREYWEWMEQYAPITRRLAWVKGRVTTLFRRYG